MNLLVVGDVHGCYFTFKKLLRKHWNPHNTILIQVGDIINKGPHSLKCVRLLRMLKKRYPHRVEVLRGNHEHNFLTAFYDGKKTRFLKQVYAFGHSPEKYVQWFSKLPLKYENPYCLISHAGVSPEAENPFSFEPDGVLHYKGPLKNIGKLQVIGHQYKAKRKWPYYSLASNSWCLATGAPEGNLSGVLINAIGKVEKVISIPTHSKDI